VSPRESRSACARVLDDEDEQPVEVEVLDRGPRECEVAGVRWVERPAEDP
jgi:hypothetical protein